MPVPKPGRDRGSEQPSDLAGSVMDGQHQQGQRRELHQDAVGRDPARVVRILPAQSQTAGRDDRFPPRAPQHQDSRVDPGDRERADHHVEPAQDQQVVRSIQNSQHRRLNTLRGLPLPGGRPDPRRNRRDERQPLAERRVDGCPRHDDAAGDHVAHRANLPIDLVPVVAKVDATDASEDEDRHQHQRRQRQEQPERPSSGANLIRYGVQPRGQSIKGHGRVEE